MIIKCDRASKQDSWDKIINIYYANNIVLTCDVLQSLVSHEVFLIIGVIPMVTSNSLKLGKL